MTVHYVPLRYTPGVTWAALRELSGRDEQGVAGTHTAAAIALLNGLLVDEPDADLAPGAAATLPAADRDRLLAAVYRQTYGARIESDVRCSECDSRFDMSFELTALLESRSDAAAEANVIREADGTFRQNGYRFRLPSGADELEAGRLPPAEQEAFLLGRCLLEGTAGNDALQAAMAAVAPVLDLDLSAPCPKCDAVQPVHFDMQYYLLASLQREQPRLAREVHRLALAYSWSLPQILALPRSMRRQYVSLVEAESAAFRRGRR